MVLKATGRIPSGERLTRIKQSPNYRNGAFQNIEPTEVLLHKVSFLKLMKEWFNKADNTRPKNKIPSVKTDLHALDKDKAVMIWFGHSSYYIQSQGYKILVDPVLSGYTSPVPIFGKSFEGTDIYAAADVPEIDLLVITHDHYDHLDFKSISLLKNKTKKILTSLGVGSHLEYWGVSPDKITELDWWETAETASGIRFTATPSRHFSGRLFKRGQTLWSSFVLDLHGHKIFLGGDSGYSDQFEEIGKEHGPFELALLDGAQYGPYWPMIHMAPEETVRAAKKLGAKVLMPVHWGRFALSNHAWNEPVRRIIKSAAKEGMPLTTPRIGEIYVVGGEPKTHAWWEEV